LIVIYFFKKKLIIFLFLLSFSTKLVAQEESEEQIPLGAKAVGHFGLRQCLWPMTLSMLVPCVVYVALSYWQPRSLMIVGLCVLAYGLSVLTILSTIILSVRCLHLNSSSQ
jgi:hypothetical protein